MGSAANAGGYADVVDFSFSLVVMGDSGVGKTLLVACTQPASAQEAPGVEPQYGLQSKVHTYESRGALYKVRMWEVPGAPRYQQGASRYASLAAGVVLVFDVNRRPTFERIAQWLEAVNSNGTQLPAVLIGNKADLPTVPSRVSSGEAEDFAARHSMQYFETSAMGNQGVTEAFSTLMAMVIGQIPNPPEPSLLVKTRIQIGRKLADNRAFRAALFDLPAGPST
ncbi:P-loop containing nucleoside triphosphate hydrolase protein [Pavlovales sp. CCMP2436]|nr:P-loop containing nucleoside triphosphate hydrolase protein [Pavlovales sp. CCMP2436]